MGKNNRSEVERIDGEELTYYTHPNGKVEEMKRSEAEALENPEPKEEQPPA